MFVEFDELAAKNLRVKSGADTVDIQLAKLKEAAVGMNLKPPDKALEVLGATLKSIEMQGVQITHEVDRTAPPTPGKPGAAPDPWKLDALSGLDGTLNLTAFNVDVVGDVNAAVPIRSGVIDFKDVNGDDGYFPPGDIWFFIDDRHIWARHYKVPITLYPKGASAGTRIPGVNPARIEYTQSPDPQGMPVEVIHSRGSLNLKEFLEGTLNEKSSGTGKPAEPLDFTNTLQLEGNLEAGEGVLGRTKDNVTLSGRAVGKNRISISSTRLGSDLLLRIPEFQASKSQFELMGKAGETGQINANVKLQVNDLGSGRLGGRLTFTVSLTVLEGVVRDIKFGNVSLASAPALKALPAPPKEK
jgi:hypothetical protein